MPQASDDLRAKFPEHDSEAWAVLAKAGFTHDRGVIRSPQNHRWSQRERDAVDYLCDEWDWAYIGPQDSSMTAIHTVHWLLFYLSFVLLAFGASESTFGEWAGPVLNAANMGIGFTIAKMFWCSHDRPC